MQEKKQFLQKAKAEEQIQTNNSQKAEKQNQYMQNIAQIEQLQDQLRGLTDAKGEEAQAIQSSIDALLSDNDAIVNQCNQLDLLSASLREATGAYQNWLDKQNASESGDMFDDAMGAMEKIDNVTKNSDSEDYGRIGTNSYKAAVDFIVPDAVDSQDAEAVSSYMSSIEHYKPSEGKECNRAENLQLLPREIHKNLTYYASKPDAEHNKELEEKIKNADCPSFQFPQEQFQDLLMVALYDCNVSGGKAIMYTTTITDNVEDIEAEAHVLDVGKILKQNLEECE